MRFAFNYKSRTQLVGALALLSTLLGVAWFALQGINSDPLRSPQADVLGVSQQGMSVQGANLMASAGDGSRPSILAARVALEPDARYLVSIDVQSAPNVPAEILVDLFAPGYDHPAQEVSVVVVPSDQHRQVHVRLNAGPEPPPEAEMRIVYAGDERLTIGNVRLSRVPGWRVFLESTCGMLALVAMAAFALLFGTLYAPWEAGSKPGKRIAAAEAGGLALLFFVAAAIRWYLSSLVPYWSGDELVYKVIASGIWEKGRVGIPSADQVAHQTNLPNMLYPYIISPAFAFGREFYDVLRLINALVLAAVVLPAYFIACRFVSKPLSFFTAIAAVTLPSAFLASFAVTEPLYYPLFLATVLAGLRSLEAPASLARALAFGIALGVLLNVRLNGIVLAPAWLVVFVLTLVYCCRDSKARALASVVAGLASAVVVYYAIKGELSPRDAEGLGFYENRSGGWISTAMSVALSDPKGLLQLVLGHMTILAIPFSLGIAGAICLIWTKGGSIELPRRFGALFLLLICGGCVAFAIVFTLGVSPVDLGGLGRWHSRYYFSVFPLLILLSLLGCQTDLASRRIRLVPIILVGGFLLALVAFVPLLHFATNPWFGATVDSMEVHWLRFWRAPLFFLFAGMTAATLLWGRRVGTGMAVATVTAWLLVANMGTLKELRRMPTRLDPHCGAVMQQKYALDSGKTAIVVSERRFLVDNLFWISGLPVRSLVLGSNNSIDAKTLDGASFLLTDPAIKVGNASLLHTVGQCNLYKVN